MCFGHNKRQKDPQMNRSADGFDVPFSSSSVQTTKLNTVLVFYDKYVKINILY